ncbi:MAG: class I SAM-dependent methyltransferase [Streptomycetaceae bacterium]|nr:MAG: class I SAM-dependent methyltransferase [Streptomycetaceae bacterium]
MTTSERDNWAQALSKWAIPKDILDQAQESPWIHPPALFQIPEKIELTISHQRALEVLPDDGSVLDIGCGGGIATFALTPPASHVIGVDHQIEMLEMFSRNASERDVTCETFDGFWPGIADEVPAADIATAHHVVYNVSDIGPFLSEMNSHANKRVIIEMPVHHPLANMSAAWKHFWNLDRPVGPVPTDLVAVLKEIGISAKAEYWSGQMRSSIDFEQDSEFMRIRLCLPKERLDEVREFLKSHPGTGERDLATIWWDV